MPSAPASAALLDHRGAAARNRARGLPLAIELAVARLGSLSAAEIEAHHEDRFRPGFLVEPVEAVSFVMSQKMLRGIRDLAEHAA